MKKTCLSFVIASIFWLVGTAPLLGASNEGLDRIVNQIDAMFPPLEGVVVSIDRQILTLDLKQGQPIKPGDRLKLIRFGKDIIHPISKKKIGRKETDLSEVEVIEVRQNFSLAKLTDPTALVRTGDGVRSPFNELSFLVATPRIETKKNIDKNRLRIELEETLAMNPRFKVPAFELGLWLLENNLSTQDLLTPKYLDKLGSQVKADYLMVLSVDSIKKKLILSYKLYSARTGQLEKQAKIMSDELPIKQGEQRKFSKHDTQRSFARPVNRLVRYANRQEFQFKIVDLDVGDVNGDGREELVVVTPNRVIVYDYKNKKLKQVARFRTKNENHKLLGVDVGDINRNGRDEIFVTGRFDNSLSSFVLEADPGKKLLKKTWDDVNLYFRIIHPFGSRPTLLVQSPGSNGPFQGSISRMVYRKGRYAAHSKLKLPKVYGTKFIVYGLTWADIDGDKKREILMLDKNHKLRVYSARGRVLVQSEEHYGRDPRSFDLGVREEGGGVVQEGEPVPYKGRLQLIRQGNNRYLLLPKNTSAGGGFIPGLMVDTHGSITFLKLTPEGLDKSFKLKKQKGYIAAYGIIKAQNNQPTSLHMATVETQSGLGGKVLSTVYSYYWQNRDSQKIPN
jgi:hypothetical protein